MRMLMKGGVLLLVLQVVVHGRNVNSDLIRTTFENVTDNVYDKRPHSVNGDLESVVPESRPSYTDVPRVSADINNDIKSQTEISIDTSERMTPEENDGNVVSEVMDKVTATTSVESKHFVTDKKTPAPKPFQIPDQIDKYSNSILLEGHVFGIRDNILTMIHMALSASNTFLPVEPLRIDPLDSSYEEMGYEGDKFTHIRYVVSYNGNPIHTEVITRLMSTPKVSHHFKKQLGERQMREYKAPKSVKNEPWIHDHIAAVVVPSCIAFVVILALVFAVSRKRYVKAAKFDEKKKSSKSNVVSDKKCPPPPYSVVNPAYSS